MATRVFENGDVAAALADGAGSAKFSHYGSNLVVDCIAQLVSEHFNEAFGDSSAKRLFKQRLVDQLKIDLHELAKRGLDLSDDERVRYAELNRTNSPLVSCSMSDLACTALCVVVRNNRYVAVHVGDGVIGAEFTRKGKTQLKAISKPDNGEFANETRFVTSQQAADSARLITGRIASRDAQVTGFILISDGPEASLYSKRDGNLVPACSKLLTACRTLDSEMMHAQLESTLQNVIAQKTADDCSIALIA